jgi:CheY-like chemotaxis protein
MAQVILLIEPETIVCEVLLVCLRKLGGWTVIPASSIQAGLDWLRSQQPDVIILDTSVLEEESLRFIQALSHNAATAQIPILLLINHAAWLTSRKLKATQVIGTIAKPFNPITLPLEVAHLLGWSLGYDRCPLPAADSAAFANHHDFEPDFDSNLDREIE